MGAIVLLSDGEDNAGGIDLRHHRRAAQPPHPGAHGGIRRAGDAGHDVEIDDAVVAPRAMADSRSDRDRQIPPARLRGTKIRCSRCATADKLLSSRDITFGSDGQSQTENVLFNVGDAGAKALQFSIEPLPGEENRANNT